MTPASLTRGPVLALAIGIASGVGCSDGADGSGASGDAGGSGGTNGQAGSGVGGSGLGGGDPGSGASGGHAGANSGDAGSGGMAGSAGSGGSAGADAGGGASGGIVDGSLDPTFGAGGIVVLDRVGEDLFAGVTIQPSGRIVVAGMLDRAAFVGRYTADGVLDPSFGDMGLVFPALGGTFSIFTKVDQQSDGSLIAAGHSIGDTDDIVVARFSMEGQLDSTFGTGGITLIDAGGDDSGAELIVLPDDTLLIGGELSHAGTGTDSAVAHLDADGVPDPGFGSAGLAFADYDQYERPSAIARDSRGRIVLGVTVAPDDAVANRTTGFARFTAEGVLDGSFGEEGWIVVPKAGAMIDEVQALTVLDGDDILATGFLAGELGLTRLTSTGAVDATFGASGRASAGFPGIGRAFIREPGSMLVFGATDTQAVVVRFTEAGDLDPSLAGTGFRTYDLGPGDTDVFFAAVRQADGRVVVVGSARGEDGDGALVRLDVR